MVARMSENNILHLVPYGSVLAWSARRSGATSPRTFKRCNEADARSLGIQKEAIDVLE